jgi:tRNA pseudouridine55 synthase
VRTLAHDIGARLGCGAHLTALRRTAVGRLTLAQALTLEALEAALEAAAAAGPAAVLLPMTAAVEGLPAVRVSAALARRVITGQPIAAPGEFADGQSLQVIAAGGALVGVARFRQADQSLHPWVVVADVTALKS